MTDSVKLLEGIVAVDLGAGMAPALVAKFLADNGARVIRVEPAGGDPFYAHYPAYEVWRRGAERNDEAGRDPAALDQLLAGADLCITGGEDFPGLEHRRDADALAAAHPRLVLLDLGGNPHGVAGAERPSTDLLAQARTGLCYEQYSDRPLAMSFEPATYGAALQGLCALLAALYERESSGRGQIARTSLFEGALSWLTMYWGEFERPTPGCGVNPKDPYPLIFRCADGQYIHLVMGGANSKYKLYQLLGIDDPSVKPGDNGLPNPAAEPRNFYGDIDLLSEHVGRHDSASLLAALWDAGIPAEPVLQPGECWDHPQVEHNGIVGRGADGTRHLASPIIARRNKARGKSESRAGSRPLEGVRIVDLGAFMAGPLASLVLSDLGADVVKVEPIGGEASRALVRGYLAPNRGKRGVAIDLKSPKGLEIVQAMAKGADVVASNFRSGVSTRLGVDPASLHALRPDLVVLESPGYGAEGPLAQRGVFDLVMQALCGHEARGAGPGNDPFWNRTFMVDATGGLLGAIGLLAALIYRRRSGNGVGLTVPLLNAGIFLLSELVQRPDGRFEGADPVNATRTGYRPPEAMYEASDGWLAIVARDDAQRRALVEVLGISGRVAPDAQAWGETEASLIAAVVSGRKVAELAAALEAFGVWAEPCRKDGGAAVIADPAFETRGTVRVSTHPRFGRIRELGSLYTLSRSRVGNARPLHEIGEHTGEVLRELGFDDAAIDALLAEGVVSDGQPARAEAS